MATADVPHGDLYRDVVCPFCALACDDLTIEVRGDALQVVEAGCALSRRRFAATGAAAPAPPVGGPAVAMPAAVARAAEILENARAPVFVVVADVAGARAALALADRVGAAIDHPGSEALFRHLRAVQDAGALTTTLSEVRRRAD
ncbi:MAG: formylmethanofuran dehydrogenase, partial [Rhodospirillaceae bacterium]|nr:formylmethanofuran dehydrogenase [Rhodospirillaceae bacterium]